MTLRGKTTWRLLGLAGLLVLAAGFIAPQLNADRFGHRVQRSLEQALGRRVEIQGKVHLDLFNGPGFSVDNVILDEDPRIGLEPLAYVESLEARVSFKSLWTGRLEFSSLRLVNPSVNLSRSRAGGWNYDALLTRTVGAGPAGVHLPEIHVRGGRINFKPGDTKSIFYFSDVSLDAIPPSSPGSEWRLRFEGEPARTDRPAHGFGHFTARGRWWPDRRTGGNLDLEVRLEKSSLADLIRLVRGHDIGLHGQITSQAHLAGPVSDVRIGGRVQVGDIHRWDLLPSHGEGWPLDYRGRLDLAGQVLELETVPAAGEVLPLSFRLRASGYLNEPRWGMLVTFNRLPLAPLPEVARHMGVSLPASLLMEGRLAGVLGYSPGTGFQGMLAAEEASLKLPDVPALQLAEARVLVDGTRLRLQPAAVRVSDIEEATLEADYSWQGQALEAMLSTDSMPVPAPENGWDRVLGGVPVLRDCRQGDWQGELVFHWQAERSAAWTGTFTLEDARLPVPGLADPLELASARVAVREDGVTVDRISGRAGAVEFKGEYRYRPKAVRPHHVRLAIAKTDAAQLERVLMPALNRRESLLARALRLGRSRVPAWMENRHAEGTIEIGSFDLADLHLDELRGRLRWDGPSIDISELSARFGDGRVNGHLSANLRHAVPSYRLSGRFRAVNWMSGQWDGKGLVQTSGTGADLLRNLQVEGAFRGRAVSLAADTELKNVSGTCTLSLARGLPRLLFSDLEATIGEDAFRGQGASGADGRLYFEFSDGQKQMRMSGTLSPFQLELVAGRSPG